MVFLKTLLGPVPAVTEALKKAGLTIKDMDLVEVCGTHRGHFPLKLVYPSVTVVLKLNTYSLLFKRLLTNVSGIHRALNIVSE